MADGSVRGIVKDENSVFVCRISEESGKTERER